jgi:YbbR domain-containing protein
MKEQTARVSFLERIPFRPTRSQLMRFLFSLLIATLLWGWVTQRNDPFATMEYREVDVKVDALPASLQIVTTLPKATVTLQGPRSELNNIRRADVSVALDTSEVTEPGEYRLKLRVSTPNGPNERSVEPNEVPVTIEEHVSNVMPLVVEPAIPEDDPRQIGEITPDVTQVTVSGPSSAVDRVDRVLLPIAIDNQTTSFEETYTPYAVDANGQRVSEAEVLPAQIRTSVELQTRGKTISVIPQISGTPAEGFSVQQRTALPDTVLVDGPEEALNALLFVNTEPVDITGATQSISQRVELVDLPDGVTVTDPASGTVEVRVAIEDISTTAQTLNALPIEPLNLAPGLDALIEPRTLNVTVDGPSNALTRMTPSDVKIRVDLSGLGPGTHDVQPEITVPQGVTWIGNDPEVVEVTISAGTPQSDNDAAPLSTPGASRAPGLDILSWSAPAPPSGQRRLIVPVW